jgi:hypothetical protein
MRRACAAKRPASRSWRRSRRFVRPARRSTGRACRGRSERCLPDPVRACPPAAIAQSFSTIWLAPIPAAHHGVSSPKQTLNRFHIEVEDVPIRWHRVLHAHHELNVGRAGQLALVRHLPALKMWLRSNASISGFTSWPASRRPASRPGRAGSHRPGSGSCSSPPRAMPCPVSERQHPSALLARARPPAGRELDDHAGAVLFEPLLQKGEFLRVTRRRLIVVAHMGMDRCWRRPRRPPGCFRPVRTRLSARRSCSPSAEDCPLLQRR